MSFLFPSYFSRFLMLSTKRLADVGYRVFSGSMMLLTLYGGYLCAMRGYRYMQRQKQLQLVAQNQNIDSEIVKD
ncbi:cytochrome c oxidase assembly protein COX14-like [Silurus asotus]|uniref:Cytochrome c oxidase assembly protein COX14-like n=1 Tax=Silurus asotus TaxID=30991 RepID=A0AAD5F9P5_SILAS|nr:cytochrome c oxidase assembly protein COX14-like [Silurus asotus]